ncbi:expressed unknown protein [Seminavis robusta]|uniref:Fungal lipase-type domain-containing protein n=1 Tax=Seminavis robusta TaxID=568900 RepID=A0A9N8DDP5_9STRA|nr:expressed unknown protein [Seminavis robusta]|eukprot:Sro99_g051000.1 n/a (225) ;mRNA; r:85366-86040
MGTDPCNLFDQFQNIWPFSTCVPNSDCAVRSGYYNAYYNSYYKKMRHAVTSCVESCGAGVQCPLILHGHSQGGSIATIASIDLREYNPITMTFGTPRAILKSDACTPCNILDTSRHYRFINTIDGRYDERVMNNLFCNYRQVGNAILLDNDNSPTIATVGLDNDLIRSPTDVGIHDQLIYTERINAIADPGCFPIPLTNWPAGHWCSEGDECASGNCQDRLVCV